jgi:hypothetical protein
MTMKNSIAATLAMLLGQAHAAFEAFIPRPTYRGPTPSREQMGRRRIRRQSDNPLAGRTGAKAAKKVMRGTMATKHGSPVAVR